MENVYHSISKAINIDEDRKEYTRLYDFVRQSIINGLKENDIFKALFADLCLCGSYADNLKVSKPDEFDLVVRLKLPYHGEVYLEEDLVNLGNVWLNLSNVIYRLQNEKPQRTFLYTFLNKIVNDDDFLLLDKFQNWFEGILTRYLNSINNQLLYEDEKVLLRYIKQGPAHTLKVSHPIGLISIDVVPGFLFTKSQSISPASDQIDQSDTWEAIPKPAIGRSSNPSFQCSYTASERRLLSGRNQFKNALRMMKKFRDMHPSMVNLKSYFIKTLFLLNNDTRNRWDDSNVVIMDEMFEVLETALKNRKIPFYWDRRVNLLRNLSNNQIDVMYYEVKNARSKLAKRSSLEDLKNIKDLFLTRSEQEFMPAQLEQEIERNFLEIAKDVLDAATPYLPWIAGIAAGALVIGAAFNSWNRGNNNN